MYVQEIRTSIYKTRQLKHPHSPIRRYKQRPQGPPRFTSPLHRIFLFFTDKLRLRLRLRLRLWPREYPPPLRSPWAHRRVAILTIWYSAMIPVIDIHKFFWSPILTWIDSQFSILLNSMVLLISSDSIVVLIWLDSIFFWIDSLITCLFLI